MRDCNFPKLSHHGVVVFTFAIGQTMTDKKFVSWAGLCLLAALSPLTAPALAQVQYADQGASWTKATRAAYYGTDQGARVIPYAWIAALKTADGKEFLGDGLARYGYFPNPDSATPGLPAGFHTADQQGVKTLGINCSACHSRQIEVEGVAWRIDGGPALSNFQNFLADLDAAMTAVTASDAGFKSFSDRVLGASTSDVDRKKLRSDVDAWFLSYHTIMRLALPTPGWGVGRADAVSMIFNRVAGLDIGPGPTHIIEGNIARADAPVRYPFVWSAPRQDYTQWPGFAKNGDDLLGLARNLGEVYGVFGVYHPEKDPRKPSGVDFLANAFSPQIFGLLEFEQLVRKMGPPKWAWKLDAALVAKGKDIFDRAPAQGGCGPGCHEIKPGEPRLLKGGWRTPLADVGTDRREYSVLTREASTGNLEGALVLPVSFTPLKSKEPIIKILGASVIGAIEQEPLDLAKKVAANPLILIDLPTAALDVKDLADPHKAARAAIDDALKDMFRKEIMDLAHASAPPEFKYEAKVMQGIWATAPYLHNGSVPSLVELLKPPAERVASFKVGPAYDLENVGLAKEQPKSDYTYVTTGCEDLNSGNSRCGHDYGTWLSPEDKKALLEYLKQL
jgi:hypothetical protein